MPRSRSAWPGAGPGRRPEHFQEETIRQLEDVRFVHAADGLSARLARPLERKAEEATAGNLRDDLDALDHAGDNLMFNGGIEVLGQLANDEKIHALESGRQAAEILERADRREQSQLAAELNVVIYVGRSLRRQQLGLQGESRLPYRPQHFLRQWWSATLKRRQPGQMFVPGDVHAGCVQDSLHGGRLIKADAASLNQCGP